MANYLSIMAASWKLVTDTIKINVAYMSAKISQGYCYFLNVIAVVVAVVLRLKLKSIMLKC